LRLPSAAGFAGQFGGSGRILAVGLGGSAVAVLLHLPWSLGFLDGWESLVGVSSNGGFPLGLGDVLRFGTGPFGTGVFGWLLLVTALLPLFIGRQWRLSWAVRGWVLALVGFALAWVVGQGWLESSLPAPSMLLVPAALGIALAAGLGMAAFEIDLPDYHFGWRQIVSLFAALAFIGALGPAFVSSFSGRWELPRGDFNRSLSFLGDGTTDGAYRVLWLGDASAIPLQGWALDAPAVDDLGPDRTLAYATTVAGTPTIAEQWPGSDSGATGNLARALQTASDGGTARLGALLSPMAVRYVAVPVAPAPDPYARSRASIPTDLLSVLDAQLDLESITVNPGVRVYRNSAWAPGVALLPSDTQLPSGGPSLSDRTDPALQGSTAVLTDTDGYASSEGELDTAGEVYVASAGDGWQLSVNGESLTRSSAFGWSSSFTATEGGPATLSFQIAHHALAPLAGPSFRLDRCCGCTSCEFECAKTNELISWRSMTQEKSTLLNRRLRWNRWRSSMQWYSTSLLKLQALQRAKPPLSSPQSSPNRPAKQLARRRIRQRRTRQWNPTLN